MASKRRVASLAVASIFVALGVMGLKFVAWWVTGSIALFSDALESIVNVIAAAAAFAAIRVSHTPPDENHPFGHHKAEYFSAVLEGVLIVVAALLIIAAVWINRDQPADLSAPWGGLAISGVGVAINAAFAALLLKAGREERSPALSADGRHIMTDVVTSIGVIVGLGAVAVTGWSPLDPILALIVAVNILWQGWHVITESLHGLMDRAVDPVEAARIRTIILGNTSGALEIHDLKTRTAGRATFIEFHLVVDTDMSVGAAHAICDRIEDALKAQIPSVRVVIHVEPEEEATQPGGPGALSSG